VDLTGLEWDPSRVNRGKNEFEERFKEVKEVVRMDGGNSSGPFKCCFSGAGRRSELVYCRPANHYHYKPELYVESRFLKTADALDEDICE